MDLIEFLRHGVDGFLLLANSGRFSFDDLAHLSEIIFSVRQGLIAHDFFLVFQQLERCKFLNYTVKADKASEKSYQS